MTTATATDDEKYIYVVNMIKSHGVPSKKYKGDVEIEFGKLRELCSARISGLQVVLKTLKNKKAVDFFDAAQLKDDTIISLVGTWEQALESEIQRFEAYSAKFKGAITDSFR